MIAVSLLTACNSPDSPENKTKLDTVEPIAEVETRAALNGNKPPRVFLRCRSCHAYEPGKKNAVGPNLWNTFGNPAATADETYKYSQALTDSRVIWDEETLHAFLLNPSKTVPGTKMAFVGLKKEDMRAELIEWMSTLNAEN